MINVNFISITIQNQSSISLLFYYVLNIYFILYYILHETINFTRVSDITCKHNTDQHVTIKFTILTPTLHTLSSDFGKISILIQQSSTDGVRINLELNDIVHCTFEFFVDISIFFVSCHQKKKRHIHEARHTTSNNESRSRFIRTQLSLSDSPTHY